MQARFQSAVSSLPLLNSLPPEFYPQTWQHGHTVILDRGFVHLKYYNDWGRCTLYDTAAGTFEYSTANRLTVP